MPDHYRYLWNYIQQQIFQNKIVYINFNCVCVRVCGCMCACVRPWTQYPLTMLQLFVGDIYSLLNFMSFLRWTFIGLVVLGLIYLRFTKPDLRRPFKVSNNYKYNFKKLNKNRLPTFSWSAQLRKFNWFAVRLAKCICCSSFLLFDLWTCKFVCLCCIPPFKSLCHYIT